MRRTWAFLLRRSLPPTSLAGLSYAVFGLGDSGYVKYNVSSSQQQPAAKYNESSSQQCQSVPTETCCSGHSTAVSADRGRDLVPRGVLCCSKACLCCHAPAADEVGLLIARSWGHNSDHGHTSSPQVGHASCTNKSATPQVPPHFPSPSSLHGMLVLLPAIQPMPPHTNMHMHAPIPFPRPPPPPRGRPACRFRAFYLPGTASSTASVCCCVNTPRLRWSTIWCTITKDTEAGAAAAAVAVDLV
jgi:hypothetical protein